MEREANGAGTDDEETDLLDTEVKETSEEAEMATEGEEQEPVVASPKKRRK
jgi:hypothetical protein